MEKKRRGPFFLFRNMRYQSLSLAFRLSLISCLLTYLGALPLQVEGISLFGRSRANDARQTAQPRGGSPNLELIQASEKARNLWNKIEAKSRMSPCWKRSMAALRSDCATIRADGALRTRLALGMAACDSESDDRGGASSFLCSPQQDPHKCVKGLSEPAYAIFIQYRLHTDVLCAFLQEELFQQRTEASVAALESAAELSIDSLTNLQQNSARLLRTAEDTMEAHQESKRLTVELQEVLQKLQEDQTSTMHGLRSSAHGILRTSKDTEESLLHMKELLNTVIVNASSKLDKLASRAAEHYASMEERTGMIFDVLKYIEKTHEKMVRHTTSLRAALQYILVVSFIVLSTMPRRTAAARLPALSFLVIGLLACVLTGNGSLRHVPWLVVSVVAATMTVGYFAYTYVSLECLQRQIVHEEVIHVVKKSQMDLMAWIEAKDTVPPLYRITPSVPTAVRMPPMPSAPHQPSHSLMPWGRQPEESVLPPINTISLPKSNVLSDFNDHKCFNQSGDAHSERSVLEIDVEPSRTSSPEVTIPKNPRKPPPIKRPRTKNAASALTKPTQSTRRRRRRIEK